MFSDKLYEILNDLQLHKSSRSDVLSKQVELRLDASLKSYAKSLYTSSMYLESKDELRVLKKMNRMTSNE